jgi:hypothetical protein
MKNGAMTMFRSENKSWQLLEIGLKEGCNESSVQEAVPLEL